jgi:signal peptidase II
MRGYVVDWIQLPHWPVFNLADAAIVCGGALAILLSARGFRIEGTRDGARGHQHPDPGSEGETVAPRATAPPTEQTLRRGMAAGAADPARLPESGVSDSGVRQP